MKTVLLWLRWLANLFVVDGVSAVVCTLIAWPFAAWVGGTTGYLLGAAAITAVFTLAGIVLTSGYYSQNEYGWLHRKSNQFVKQLTLPSKAVTTRWNRVANRNRLIPRWLVSAVLFVASAFYMGGVITMVFRTEARQGKKERFFWPLLVSSTIIYAAKLGFTYAGVAVGGTWLVSRFL